MMLRSRKTWEDGIKLRFAAAALATTVFAMPAFSQSPDPNVLDPKVLSFQKLDDVKWSSPLNAPPYAMTIAGDPSKPGLYVQLVKWPAGNNMSRPHFHPHDRYITVLKGTWWVGTGTKYQPDQTVAMKAGTVVKHYGNQVHYDGSKDEDAIILIVGDGPATATPAEEK